MGNVAKVSEISALSENGFEDAIKVGLARADKTLRNIQPPGGGSRRSRSRRARWWPIRSTGP